MTFTPRPETAGCVDMASWSDVNESAAPPMGTLACKLKTAVWVIGASDNNTWTGKMPLGDGRETQSLGRKVAAIRIRDCHP